MAKVIFMGQLHASRKILRVVAFIIASLVLFLTFAAPIALYMLGLHNVDGRPSPPVSPVDAAADMKLLQQAFHSGSAINVTVLNPWTFVSSILSKDSLISDNGSRATWVIVRNYNSGHLKYRRGMTWWHLSGAALTIWVTRHWTTDQVVAAAASIVRTTFPVYNSSSLSEVGSLSNLPGKLAALVGYHWKCCGMVDLGEDFQPTDVIGGPDRRFIVAGVSKDSALVAYEWGNGWERGIDAAAYVYAAEDWHLIARWHIDSRPSSLAQLVSQTKNRPLGITEGHYLDAQPNFDSAEPFPAR